MVKKFLTIMFASVMAMLAFTAYSNDDEPQGPFGEKMLENIDKIIVDQADAGNLYQKKDDAARFILVADSKEAAHGVCEKFILDSGTESNALSNSLTTAAESHSHPVRTKVSFTPFRSMLSRISKNRT